jgi:uncharacterized protein (DUF362 family)
MSLVSFVKIKKESAVKKYIENSLNLINYKIPHKIRNVVIKPNLCYYWDYSTGLTTDPHFVSALIEVLRSHLSSNVNFSIVESDASAMRCNKVFKILGYERLFQKNDVSLVNLSKDQTNRVKVKSGKLTLFFDVPQTIQSADLKINVPKIKYTTPPIQLTCALKNIYGCNPYPRKFVYHRIFAPVIVGLNKVMKFDLVIVDGNIVGNIGLETRKMGLIMASRDPVAVDAAAAEILGLKVNSIRYLMLAAKEGIGNPCFISRGDSISFFKAIYPRMSAKSNIANKLYKIINLVKKGK